MTKDHSGDRDGARLNAICPYYTMYPLDFPLRVLRNAPAGVVLDPFCGRGTTNFAARMLGRHSVGLDSNPVAVAIAKAKLVDVQPHEIVDEYHKRLQSVPRLSRMPSGPFWAWAYNEQTLHTICRLREALKGNLSRPAAIALRGILLGALHGPRGIHFSTHLSNQSPRTFAPKPTYATKFWRSRRMHPKKVDVESVVGIRAERFYANRLAKISSIVLQRDSRIDFQSICPGPIGVVVTSPPYYGMRTYGQDQWLRNWFLGGPAEINYAHPRAQMSHQSVEAFTYQLRKVWKNASRHATSNALLVCRFGAINDRDIDPVATIKNSLDQSGWKLSTIRSADNANNGRRQAAQFGVGGSMRPRTEFDFYARRI